MTKEEEGKLIQTSSFSSILWSYLGYLGGGEEDPLIL
jgi:hypothetical protein